MPSVGDRKIFTRRDLTWEWRIVHIPRPGTYRVESTASSAHIEVGDAGWELAVTADGMSTVTWDPPLRTKEAPPPTTPADIIRALATAGRAELEAALTSPHVPVRLFARRRLATLETA